MTKRIKRPRDPSQLAHLVMQIATGEVEDKAPEDGKDPKRQAAGAKGGQKGGKARAKSLTPGERKAIAKKGAAERWKKD